MRLFQRAFLKDTSGGIVMCATASTLLFGALIFLRVVERIAEGRALVPTLVSGSEDLAELLFGAWPLCCTLGITLAIASWARRRQDQIVASAGVSMFATVWPAALIQLSVLWMGSELLTRCSGPSPEEVLLWETREEWGVASPAVRGEDHGWTWTAVSVTPQSPFTRSGWAGTPGELPAAARAQLGDWSPAGLDWVQRIVLLLALDVQCLYALRYAAAWISWIALAGPLLGWLLAVIVRLAFPIVASGRGWPPAIATTAAIGVWSLTLMFFPRVFRSG